MTRRPTMIPFGRHNGERQRTKSEWTTPAALFDSLDRLFGFTLDACATPENAKCSRFYTREQDGLSQPWDGIVWCNPPYRGLGKWVRKAFEESQNGATVVLLAASVHVERLVAPICDAARRDHHASRSPAVWRGALSSSVFVRDCHLQP